MTEVRSLSRIAEALFIALVILVGVLLLAPQLRKQSVWLDESLTIGPALTASSLKTLAHEVRRYDTQPPASHFLLYQLRKVVPPTEFYLRLPSLVAVEIGIVLLYLTLRSLWGFRMALPALVAAQFSPFLCFYALEARNYGFWFLEVAASFLSMSRLYRSEAHGKWRSSWIWAIAWGFSNGLGLWTQVFHIFVIIGQAALVMCILLRKSASLSRGGAALRAAISFSAALLLFSPWMPVLAKQLGSVEGGVGWTRDFSLLHLPYYAYSFLFGYSFGPNLRELHALELRELIAHHAPSLVLAGLVLIGAGTLFCLIACESWKEREKRWQILPILIFPIVSLAGPLLLAVRSSVPLHPRHLLFLWPFVPTVLGLSWMKRTGWKGVVVGITAVQCFALLNLLFNPYYAKDDQRAAVGFAEEHSGGHSYVLGEGWVTGFYCKKSIGRGKYFLDFDVETEDVWLLDNRRWDPENKRYLLRLQGALSSRGFSYAGTHEQFRGILLRHWRSSRLAGRPPGPSSREM